MNHLKELKNLNLQKDQYVIFGSGPLAIRGLRENDDIDILVTEKLWNSLSKTYPVTLKEDRPEAIYIGNIQILKIDYKNWSPNIPDNNILISDSEMISHYPFTKLKYLLICKKQMDGEKHKRDTKLIEEHLHQ